MNAQSKKGATPSVEDRLRARVPPERSPVMFQSWQNLLFLHWAVQKGDLEKELPPGLHIDTHGDHAWIGIVPFFMRGVRPRFLPSIPGISNFLELNVRTYVYDDTGVPGVWFFSLDASNRLTCAVARSRFHLAYRDATMTATRGEWVNYSACRRGESQTARYRYRGVGPAQTAQPGSLEFFLLERYVLYAFEQKNRRIWRGRVSHPPYQYRDAEVTALSQAPLEWDHLPLPGSREPDHVCLADNVDVRIFPLRRVGSCPQQRQAVPGQDVDGQGATQ